MKSLGWSVFLCGAESWTIERSDRDRINSLEMWCWRRLLGVSWSEHRTSESILDETGLEKGLMKSVARLKLQYFGRVSGSAGKLSLTILEGAVDGTRHQEAPRILDPQCAEMEWQDLWGIKSTAQEMEEVVVGVLISRRTSVMKKAPKEEVFAD